MSNLTIKQLRYFEALARQGHFGRAAASCSVSQPALSVQIKELEETLDVMLFERGPRQVRLTNFGEDFALRVRDILSAVDELSDLARAAQDGMTGRLRIGVIPTIAPYLLPTFISNLSRAQPGFDIHVRETCFLKGRSRVGSIRFVMFLMMMTQHTGCMLFRSIGCLSRLVHGRKRG